jgi:hypothetical protein
MIRNRLFLISLVMLLAPLVMGQSKVGTTGAAFLGISAGPRATAMGGAFAGMSDDAAALYYNPGAMAQSGSSHFIFAHTSWLVNTPFNWVGFILNVGGDNAIGVSVTQLDYGEEQVTTVTQPEGTGDRWAAKDLALSLSYGRNLTNRFSIGGSVKYIQQSVWNETASAFAMDVGLLFITNFHNMRLGMSITNFGTELQMDGRDLLNRIDLDASALGNNETITAKLKTESWPLPLFFRVGLAMDVIDAESYKLTLAADALHPTDNSEIVNIGGEFSYSNLLFLRAGYKSLFRQESEEGLTAGVGLKLYSGGSLFWTFNYTYADFGLFEEIQMFDLGVSF